MNIGSPGRCPKNRTWTYDGGVLQMIRDEGQWKVRWTPGAAPKLGNIRRSVLAPTRPGRASVIERGWNRCLGARESLSRYQLDAAGRAIVDGLEMSRTRRPFDDALDPQRLAEQASSNGPMDLITLRRADHDRLAPSDAQPGVVTPQSRPAAHRRRLCTDDHRPESRRPSSTNSTGRSGWRAVVRQSERRRRRHPQRSGPAAGARDLNHTGPRGAGRRATRGQRPGAQGDDGGLKPSTGDILAVAQNSAADVDGPAATTGCTRQGRRSRSLPAGAAIDHKMATPNTLLGCRGRSTSATGPFPTTTEFDLGTVPLSKAFANSCNTTFAELASGCRRRR